MAVSVSAEVTLTSNPVHVNSGLRLRCLLNRINHHHHPFQANVPEKVIQERTGHCSLELLWMHERYTQNHSAASCIGHQQEAVPTVTAKELVELVSYF